MRLLFIILFFNPILSFAQDTLEIKKIRFEYHIDLKTKDTTLFQKVYYYKNDFKRTELFSRDDSLELYAIDDNNNNRIEYYHQLGDKKFLNKYFYNNQNHLIEKREYINNILDTVIFVNLEYNENGQVKSYTYFRNKYEFLYNEKGELIEEIKTYSRDSSKVINEYSNNLLIRKIFLDKENEVTDEESNQYDQNGNLIYRSLKNNKDIEKGYYDKKNNLIKLEYYSRVKKLLLLNRVIYKYNKQNELISRKGYDGGKKFDSYIIYTYKYF